MHQIVSKDRAALEQMLRDAETLARMLDYVGLAEAAHMVGVAALSISDAINAMSVAE